MNENELNSYIKDYLINDKTNRALMLSAPWGSGKSYYIKNKLSSFLHENKLNYVIVSLYGIQNLKEINKELFLEIKFQKIPKKHRWLSAFGKTLLSSSAIIGKTIIKELINVNIDFNIKEPNYEKLFKYVDLKNRLVILEDLERSSIDVVEILGYINNLVEQDGVKVLIVANEEEILKSEEYLKIKEKTIGDTIKFIPNTINTLTDIIKSFNNKTFDKLLSQTNDEGELSFVEKIVQELMNFDYFNFRSVIFACQKMNDILLKLKDEPNLNFVEDVFMSVIVYVINLNKENKKDSKNNLLDSIESESQIHPLFKSTHDYITNHILNIEAFKNEEKLFLSYYNDSDFEKEFNPIFKYYISNENSIKNCINHLINELKDKNIINYNQLIRIYNYLVIIKYSIGFGEIINYTRELIISEINAAIDNNYEIDLDTFSGLELENDKSRIEFNEFINELQNYKKTHKESINDFTYKPENLKEFYLKITKAKDQHVYENGFISKFDLFKIIEMIKDSNSEQISYFRKIIREVYFDKYNLKHYFKCDENDLQKLLAKIKELSSDENIDKVRVLQLKWFSGDLTKIIDELKK